MVRRKPPYQHQESHYRELESRRNNSRDTDFPSTLRLKSEPMQQSYIDIQEDGRRFPLIGISACNGVMSDDINSIIMRLCRN